MVLEEVRWLASRQQQHVKILCFSLLRSLQVIAEFISADFTR